MTIQMLPTDRGKEFDNSLIDVMLETFDIKRTLSRKGNRITFKKLWHRIKTVKKSVANSLLFEHLNISI